MTQEWLSTAQVAEELGVSLQTVGKWCNTGRLEAKKIFGTWRISRESLEAFKETKRPGKGHKPGPKSAFVVNPEKAKQKRPRIKTRLEEVHAAADAMMDERMRILTELFPHPKPGEVYEYVLHNMKPAGLTGVQDMTPEEIVNAEYEPDDDFGSAGSKLARAEYDLRKLMKHRSESVRSLAIYLFERVQRIKEENRRIIEEYIREQDDEDYPDVF